MPKLDIEFELTGLKLKIKGESDDVSGKVGDLQRQISDLMGTINSLTNQAARPTIPADTSTSATPKMIDAPVAANGSGRHKGASRKASTNPRTKAEAVEFKHDAEKYGFPKQSWSTAQKAMFMLHMLAESGETKEFTAAQISSTFNKHFKSFGVIRPQNVLRDLGNAKGKNGAVNSDASQDPMKWFLLEAAKTQIAALLAVAKGAPAE
jgi:hypothetical protein